MRRQEELAGDLLRRHQDRHRQHVRLIVSPIYSPRHSLRIRSQCCRDAVGSIPASIGNMAQLQELCALFCNCDLVILSGLMLILQLPDFIPSLSLHCRIIPANQFNGTIPPELGKLTNLQRLYVRFRIDIFSFTRFLISDESCSIDVIMNPRVHCRSQGPPLESAQWHHPSSTWQPFEALLCVPLESHRSPALSINRLHSHSLRMLIHIALIRWLFANQLSGTIPPQLGNLTMLSSLYIESLYSVSNCLNRCVSQSFIIAISRIFWSNRLNGTIPPELSNLTELQQLYAQNRIALRQYRSSIDFTVNR